MISASAADAHRFGRVKRNGYDPAEVDAVVSRLTDTLRSYEDRTRQLEERLAEADASADAIRRTFIAAEKTRDEILDGAREQARSITDTAHGDAEEVLNVARTRAAELTESSEREAARLTELAARLDEEMAQRREAMLTEAENEADRVTAEAEAAAAERVAAAVQQAETDSVAAQRAAEEASREALLAAQAISIAASWARRDALISADEIISAAQERAAVIVADAERESVALHDRAAQLRVAIASLEASARTLADVATAEMSVVDLTEIEALEAAELDLAAAVPMPAEVDAEASAIAGVAEDGTLEPETAHGDVGAEADIRESDPAEMPPADGTMTEPVGRLLTVAEATAEIEREDDEGVAEDEPVDRGPTTYYQRSTGIPLSERVKLARKSG